jgi:hypothetical protein
MSLALLIQNFLSTVFAGPVGVAVAVADDLEKRHVYYMNCGWKQSYCNSAYYYCDHDGLLAYIFDINTICNAYCQCYSLSDPPRRPNPPPVPLFPTSTNHPLLTTFGITSVTAIWPPIPTVSPCFGDIWGWDCNNKEVGNTLTAVTSTNAVIGTTPPVDEEVKPVQAVSITITSTESLDKGDEPIQSLQSEFTSTKSLDMEVKPTEILDLEVTSPNTLDIEAAEVVKTLSKRHNYAMNCNAWQKSCTDNGYYCNSAGRVFRRWINLNACNRNCRCVQLNYAPVPHFCNKFSDKICFGVSKDVDDTDMPTQTLNTDKSTETDDTDKPTGILDLEAGTPVTLEESEAVDTLSKRHNYAMNCGAYSWTCSDNGYFCNSSGKLLRKTGYGYQPACASGCTCVMISVSPYRPPPVPHWCNQFIDKICVSFSKAVNDTGSAAGNSDETQSKETGGVAVEPEEMV